MTHISPSPPSPSPPLPLFPSSPSPPLPLTCSFLRRVWGSTRVSFPTHSATTFLVPSSTLSKWVNSTSLHRGERRESETYGSVQWLIRTNVTKRSSEVSLFQGLNCTHELFLGKEKGSLLVRCLHFRVSLERGSSFSAINSTSKDTFFPKSSSLI